MILLRAAGLLAGLLLPALALAQAPAPAPTSPNAITAPAQKTIGTPSARRRSEALIVLNAKGATLSGGTLVLNGVASSAILFASRPVRSAGHMSTADLVALWSTGSFAKDPPNATVSAFAKDGTKVTDAVVVLKSVRTEANKAIFDVAVLEGDLGKVDGPAAVFIDTIWFSLDDGVTCRCWNWRQCVRTRITHATTSAMFILDGLAELGPGGLAAAGHDLAVQLAALHPGVRLSWRQVGAVPPG